MTMRYTVSNGKMVLNLDEAEEGGFCGDFAYGPRVDHAGREYFGGVCQCTRCSQSLETITSQVNAKIGCGENPKTGPRHESLSGTCVIMDVSYIIMARNMTSGSIQSILLRHPFPAIDGSSAEQSVASAAHLAFPVPWAFS